MINNIQRAIYWQNEAYYWSEQANYDYGEWLYCLQQERYTDALNALNYYYTSQKYAEKAYRKARAIMGIDD